ncbi:hypothetical protein Bca4012_005031 [Brassica carinata]
MAGRFRREDKGKGIALDPSQAPRKTRIRIQNPDNADLVQRHALTLIGRVTNRTTQRVGSLILFFMEHWKKSSKPSGSELGNDMFQFQFDNEEDLLDVLENRPYHYDRWMIIVQRWEPTVSPSFPFGSQYKGFMYTSGQRIQLSNWVKISGYLKSQGSHPQWCECVCKINGLLPLIKSFVIKYANRDEVTANFAYEKLEKHCSKCYRLDHDIKDCLEAKHEERAFKAQEDKTRREVTESEKIRTQPSGSNVLHFSATKQAETNQRDEKKFNRHAREYDERGDIEEIRSYSPRQEISQRRYDSEDPKYRNNVHRSQLSRSSHHREAYPSNCEVSSRPRDLRRELSDRHCSMDRSLQPSRSRDRMPARSEDSAPMEPRDSSNMGIPLEEIQNSVPAAVFNEDVNEVREAMIQYTQCDDPTENAAHRARMRRVEEEGEMEDTAALMIQASLTAPTNLPHPIDQPSSAEIVPTTLRLGPPAQTTVENAKEAPKETGKRKPGRPPGKRKQLASPKLLKGASSRKRKIQQTKPPVAKRRLISGSNQGNPLATLASTSRRASGREESRTNSEDQPITNMIPASRRRRMDLVSDELRRSTYRQHDLGFKEKNDGF